MRKRIITVVTAVLVLTSPLAAKAFNVGSPGKPVAPGGSVISGSIGFLSVDVEDVEVDSKFFLFKGSFGVSDSLTPYFKAGFADISVDAAGFQGNMGFSFGGGFLLGLISPGEEGGLSVNLDSQVLWTGSSEAGADYDLFQGQLAVLGSMKSGGTTGYGGLAASFLTLDGGGLTRDESARGHIFFGFDYFMDYNFFFNLEAHLFGQSMISAGVGYLF